MAEIGIFNFFLFYGHRSKDAHLAEKKIIASQFRAGAKESLATLYSYTQSDYLIGVNLVYDVGIWYNRMSWKCEKIIRRNIS